MKRGVFLLFCALCLSPLFPVPSESVAWAPPAALVVGLVLGIFMGNPYPVLTKPLSKTLLQTCVVLLGFSMDLSKVAQAGKDGLLFSCVSISLVFGLGWVLTRFLQIRPVTGLLVSAGTAICGGSAIAAVSSVVDAAEEDLSVAVGTVFLLNALALLTFPLFGHMLHLSQHQFGLWSGIAIHDVASVVGAGATYGPEALEVGTAVKLSRVLFLVPITLLIAFFHQRKAKKAGKVQYPWFIGLFLLASVAHGVLPVLATHTGDIKRIAAAGFTLCLFLIGSTINRKSLKAVGIKPMLLGVLLWSAISLTSLLVVLKG